ncbi:hypothetical protein D9619_009109 [Psilocybe cf. subviscida]|uniref:F-box domain-containing protein n=1 Tax=Psilocybe cf. subviscida TaxID=2480587 RepID=A0A8H5BVT6_9AGAR|nr:hypothetical protein D9619_009109 [Psilocybe cf. subviscida]
MALSLLGLPSEVLQHIAFFTTLASLLGPPKELINCMLTCRTLYDVLAPKPGSELYHLIFAHKFDITAPQYRLGADIVREHAHEEMRRRFLAIQVFKSRVRAQAVQPARLGNGPLHSGGSDSPSMDLMEALWIAYVMVEDADTSQKNVKQLLRAGLPAFLDRYLRERLYVAYNSNSEGAAASDDQKPWPVIDETTSLAIALAWTLASQVVLRSESGKSRQEMIDLLAPIVFSARYSICRTPRTNFTLGLDPDPSDHGRLNDNSSASEFPKATFPPTDIAYFGTVHRKARVPSATIFATLLYFARTEISNSMIAMPHGHVMCRTREEANAAGQKGPSQEDVIHFARYCGTKFADFPGIDIGILSSTMSGSPDVVLCHPSAYKLGTLSGRWHGSSLMPDVRPECFRDHDQVKKPLYITLEEHYTCDPAAALPITTNARGLLNAWLPEDLEGVQTPQGLSFSFSNGGHVHNTVYETFQPGSNIAHLMRGKKLVDVIITGRTDDQYVAAWGGPSKVLGRVRLHDGLVTLYRFNQELGPKQDEQVLQGYVTSSQNLVGRIPSNLMVDNDRPYEGVFSLSRNHTQLVEYANVKEWIREFWFDAHGSSLALYHIRIGDWPLNRLEASLGMWIYWFVLNMGDYSPNSIYTTEEPQNVLKAMALGAHLYNLTSTPWTQFSPSDHKSSKASLYSHEVNVNPPPLATPAILSYLALNNKNRLMLIPPSDAVCQASTEWDSEWNRCVGDSKGNSFKPGSMEGVWQGYFTYTDFTGYAMLLGGAPPAIIQGSAVGRHQHTWKLREHYLLGAEATDTDSGVDLEIDDAPLRAGDPLRSYFPTGSQLTEHRDGVTVHDTQTERVYQYQRPSALSGGLHVRDIIITGEGHSAWGQFNLVGRIRPGDGLISVAKDYVDGDRGKWLYRGYLVGDVSGNLSGRWRDTLSPVNSAGYEGCFFMSRRR